MKHVTLEDLFPSLDLPLEEIDVRAITQVLYCGHLDAIFYVFPYRLHVNGSDWWEERVSEMMLKGDGKLDSEVEQELLLVLGEALNLDD